MQLGRQCERGGATGVGCTPKGEGESSKASNTSLNSMLLRKTYDKSADNIKNIDMEYKYMTVKNKAYIKASVRPIETSFVRPRQSRHRQNHISHSELMLKCYCTLNHTQETGETDRITAMPTVRCHDRDGKTPRLASRLVVVLIHKDRWRERRGWGEGSTYGTK